MTLLTMTSEENYPTLLSLDITDARIFINDMMTMVQKLMAEDC